MKKLQHIIDELEEIGFSGDGSWFEFERIFDDYLYEIVIQLVPKDQELFYWKYMRFWHKKNRKPEKKKEYAKGVMTSTTNSFKNVHSCKAGGIEKIDNYPKLEGYLEGIREAKNKYPERLDLFSNVQ